MVELVHRSFDGHMRNAGRSEFNWSHTPMSATNKAGERNKGDYGMKKKLLIVAAIPLVIIASAGTVFALSSANKIFTVPSEGNTVSTFWHDGNRCYVAQGNPEYGIGKQTNVSISCVRYK